MSEQYPQRAILFPGQGSQHIGMADAWAEHPIGVAVFEEVSDRIGYDVVVGCRDEDLLATTDFVQPALLACEVAAFRVLEDNDVHFVAAAGHSLGEFSALVAAGAMTLSEALKIVSVRGNAMQQAGQERPGTMSALIRVNTEEAAELCCEAAEDDVLVVANENSPAQVVISGSVPAIERAEALAKGKKVRAIRLKAAGAFHSELMRPAVDPIKDKLDQVSWGTPRFPIAENVSGTLIWDLLGLKSLLERHVVSPVKWESSIRALGATGITTFVEAGPGKVLTGFTRRILADTDSFNVNSPKAALSVA